MAGREVYPGYETPVKMASLKSQKTGIFLETESQCQENYFHNLTNN